MKKKKSSSDKWIFGVFWKIQCLRSYRRLYDTTIDALLRSSRTQVEFHLAGITRSKAYAPVKGLRQRGSVFKEYISVGYQ